mgnify:CR=1 FL=1
MALTSNLARYLDAATSENTQRSYAPVLWHFEIEWGGHLPATLDCGVRYLADHAGQLATNTPETPRCTGVLAPRARICGSDARPVPVLGGQHVDAEA